MNPFAKTEEYPVLAGTVCFALLAAVVVGGIVGYKKLTTGQARQQAEQVIGQASNHLQRLEMMLDTARVQLGQSGASLAPEDRIKVNSAIVVIEENMPIFHAVLSNGYSFLERNDFRSFRAAFDDRQQSNLVSVLKTDRRCLEQVVKYCQEREKLSRQAGMR